MASDKYCCVPGCKDSAGMHKVLHGFPNPEEDRDRFNTWLYAISGDILSLDNNHIYKYRRVCRSHFEEKYLCRNNRISNAAIPTLNLPGPTSALMMCNRQPLQEQQVSNRSNASLTRDACPPEPVVGIPSPVGVNQEMQKENIEPKALQLHDEAISNTPVADNKQSVAYSRPSAAKINPSNTQAVGTTKRTRRLYLSDKERDLHKQIVLARIKISKMKGKMKKQRAEIIAAKKLTNNPAVLDSMNHLSSTAKLLLQIQYRENKKKKKGRRFTLSEKILALSIFKQSPRGYRFLRNIFILPAPQTLVQLVQQSNLCPGINKNIFEQLKKKTATMTNEEKLCILLFDEVSLKPQVTFGERKAKVTGFVDNGRERKPEFADHAQVFMVRGLIHNYKQPLSYSFSRSSTKGPELAQQIKAVVSAIQEAGLTVVASVCDQGSNNRQALKILLNETRGTYLRRGEEPKGNIILINEKEIIPLYDPPHLLKGLRNNLLTKNLVFQKDGIKSTAKWSHLQLLHKENPGYRGVRLIPKLTENHVNPEKVNKMKVKFASQIFSQTVASNMGYLAGKGILPKECQQTADLLMFVDNIFDSVNGSFKKNRNAKPLLGPATPFSPHKNTWLEGKQVFKSMKFITPAGKEESVPTVNNWIWTLDGIEILLTNLEKNYGITSIWLRHLNQDPLENFFGAVRSHGCRNVNPTCDQFESAFASLLINNLINVHVRGKNCENDFCDTLHALVITENPEEPSTSTVDFEKILNINFTPLQEIEKDPRKIAPLQYMSGYFLKKANIKIVKGCSTCKNDLETKEDIEYLKYREYAGRRWLCYPSNNLINLISNMQDIINEILKSNLDKSYLLQTIKTAVIVLVDFNFLRCLDHKDNIIDFLIKIVSRCLIFNYCKNINKILTGRAEPDDDEDQFQIKAKKYNRKCFKRK